MVSIKLDPSKEKRLRELAGGQGDNVEDLARRIVEAYVDSQGENVDTPEAWAESCLALTAEVMAPEPWDEAEADDGSR